MRQEHELFLKKIEQGQPAQAVEAMLQHIANGWHELMETVPQPAKAKP